MDILKVEHLSKKFGEHEVIKDLSLSISQHSIFGFLGQNGAGKTTTMKMILGLLKADRGKITVCGEEVTYGETKTNRFIGYLPDVPEFYGYMRPLEYMKLCGEITGLTKQKMKSRSEELLEMVGLEQANKKISGFSRGMKQRLGIAQALLNEPKLLICDEPTSALDPIGRKEILDVLNRVRGKTTVLFSTHILSEVERICDSIAVLNKGELVLSGSLAEIKQKRRPDSLRIEFFNQNDLQKFVRSSKQIQEIQQGQVSDNTILIHSSTIIQIEKFVISQLEKEQLCPVKLEILEPTLESLFMEVVK